MEVKPEAPWMTRMEKGLVFTQKIEKFEDLELSITTNNNEKDSERNKPIS